MTYFLAGLFGFPGFASAVSFQCDAVFIQCEVSLMFGFWMFLVFVVVVFVSGVFR